MVLPTEERRLRALAAGWPAQLRRWVGVPRTVGTVGSTCTWYSIPNHCHRHAANLRALFPALTSLSIANNTPGPGPVSCALATVATGRPPVRS